eukprot:CAMPEP_0113291610 /NCGR_PEP_ID=MMETSP0008_2-20120614/34150_1 /TAXON_ID=97485 /ORGANISM="Prymnesium parvum" /LENGTH=68 /DNA_ID=CAMNT_0000143553 /DNA_START=1062 /DNA_END=1265 /DNA_ORIENTATION=+ /assembly_acc=CAM_ASM_000153
MCTTHASGGEMDEQPVDGVRAAMHRRLVHQSAVVDKALEAVRPNAEDVLRALPRRVHIEAAVHEAVLR